MTTAKQIIIDGIDVSGCDSHYTGWSQLYRDNRDMCDKGCDLECKPKENGCYHYTKCLEEQLKRKEQECEEFRKANDEKNELLAKLGCPTIATARRKVFCLQEQLDQLKAEKDKLKKEIAKATMEICNQCGEKDDYNIPCKQIRDLGYGLQLEIEENDKLKQTLTEIKEIAEILTPMTDEYENCLDRDRCFECDFTEDCSYFNIKQILQKISEVLDG